MKHFFLAVLLVSGCSKKADKPKTEATPTPKTTEPVAPPPVATPAQKDPVCVDDTNKSMATMTDGSKKLMGCLLAEEYTVKNLACQAKKIARFRPDTGELEECSLTTPTKLGPLLCKTSTAFYKGGAIRRCQIEEDVTVSNVELRKGDWVTLYESGSLKRPELAKASKIGEYSCKGSMNYLYESGKLKKCVLAEDLKNDKEELKAGTAICFDESGARVADCNKLDWKDHL